MWYCGFCVCFNCRAFGGGGGAAFIHSNQLNFDPSNFNPNPSNHLSLYHSRMGGLGAGAAPWKPTSR